MLVCLCLFMSCLNVDAASTAYLALAARQKSSTQETKRFVHYQVEGKHIWVDRKYNVICYKFGSYDYSCVQNAFIQVGEIK